MIFVLLLIVVLGFVIVAVLFGNSPSFRNTPLHRIYTTITRLNAATIRYVTANEKLYSALKWAVPAFYLAVVSFCLQQFFVYVYPELNKTQIIGPWHKLFIGICVLAVFVSTDLAFFSDPGEISNACLAGYFRKFPDDGLIFFGRTCTTCQWKKPARSKHCSVCNRCVLRFDHHCIWINNCVGQKNYKWFLLYLISNITMMIYGAYLCWLLLASQDAPDGYWKLIVSTTYSDKIAGMLAIMALIFSLITMSFMALHLRYIYLGVTTNEADKWGEVEYLVDIGALYYSKELGVYVEQASVNSNGVFQVVYISLDDETVLIEENDKRCESLVKINLVAELTNIYDKGFWKNLCERIWD